MRDKELIPVSYMLKFSTTILLMFLLGILAGCRCDFFPTEKIKSEIERGLKYGSDKKTIIDFLNHKGWNYSFDSHSRRYQASIPDEKSNPCFLGRHQIYLYVDENHFYIGPEVKVWNQFI